MGEESLGPFAVLRTLEGLSEKYSRPENLGSAIEYTQRVIRGEKDLSEVQVYRLFSLASREVKSGEEDRLVAYDLCDAIIGYMEDQGHRSNISSGQEHLLCGSSGCTDPDKPYSIGGVREGSMSVSEARIARSKITWVNAQGSFYSLDQMFVPVSVEPIDDEGNTIRDPMPLDTETLQPLPEGTYIKSSDFPFSRG